MTNALIRTLRGENVVPRPLWLMRQAGRYLPEYRALRAEKGGFLDLVYDHEAAAEVTLQPLRRFGFDGAILFSDILIVPHALGQKLEFLADMGMEESGLDRTIRAGYALLNLQTYFTAGPKEVRAWTVKVGATAPEAAGVIHTDFQKGFIRAEVVAYDDFVSLKGEAGAKEAGKWRLEGKEYTVADGDVIHFRFNV